MDAKDLAAKAEELTNRAKSVKSVEDVQSFVHDAVAAFRDAKEELAKVDAKSILAMLTPFLPAKYRALAGTLTTVIGLFGGGFGLSEMIDQPDSINVTIPAETQAKLDAEAAKLAEATKAADESAAKHRESLEAAIKEFTAAKDAMKAASEKKFVIRGYDKDNRTVTELDFFKQPAR